MNLFTDPIHEITFEDIKNFYETKTPESVKVDYKRDFPENERLAKLIASFANTWGGIILVGIEEKNRIPISMSGIENQGGYEEKITSICLSHINPPVTPDVHEVYFDDNKEKCIVIIRVAESDSTPHRVKNDTEIYIRVNSTSQPIEQKAPWQAIEWLIDKRKKAIENRERLINRAVNRFKSSKHYNSYSSYIQTTVIPLYPSKILFPYNEFENIINRSQIMNSISYGRGLSEIFTPREDAPISQNQSLIYEYFLKQENSSKTTFIYLEVNQYGLVFNKENLENSKFTRTNTEIDLMHIIAHLVSIIKFVLKFYSSINFNGLIFLEQSLDHIKDKNIFDPSRGFHQTNQQCYGSSKYDDSYSINKTISFEYLQENFENIICEFILEFLWSLGDSTHALDLDFIKGKVQLFLKSPNSLKL